MSKEFEQFAKDEMKRAKKIVGMVREAYHARPAEVMKIGWTRMLRTSDFPVFTRRVLEHGLNPRKWFLAAASSADYLAGMVVEKLAEDKTAESMKQAQPQHEVVLALHWHDAVGLMDVLTIESLGVLWYADSIISSANGVSHPEACSLVIRAAWACLEEKTSKDKRFIESRIEECVERLKKLDGVVWEEIVQVPVIA